MQTFKSLGLSAPLLEALLSEGYTEPTPIQSKAVPHVLAGRDIFGCAQTGTGKTAAFALPLIERMMANPQPRQPKRCRVLVLAPTRELAGQIHESFKAYGKNARLHSAVIYGGVNQRPQAAAMQRGVDVLVATPGRLLDLINQKLVELRGVEFLVLDEADRMLDMGFIHDVRKLVALVPKERQTLFFSATLPAEVRHLAETMLRNPLEVKTAPQATPAETVTQSVFMLPQRQKRHLLVHLLKHDAAIHGNKSQNQRELALAAFKSQQPPVLIATDIAARGIDVDQVSHVVNFELPHEPETYVHRIGRTGRAGFSGKAVSFCDPEERPRLQAIEKLLRRPIPHRTDLPDLPKAEPDSERGSERGSERSRDGASRGAGRPGRRGQESRSSGGGGSGRRPAGSGRPSGGKPRRQGGGEGGQSKRKERSGSTATAAPPAPAAKPRTTKKYRRAL